MAIELMKRGQSVDLLKKDPTLNHVAIALGWGQQVYDGRHPFDLDVSLFLLNANGKCRDDRDIVFYNNPRHESGSVIHSGDERTGASEGDDEVITIYLDKIPADIEKVVGVVTIYDFKARNQNFGQVRNAYARLDNAATGEQLFKYDLGEDFSTQTAVKVFELYRYNGSWKFRAVGEGYEGGLGNFVREFGLQVAGADI